MKNKLGLTIVLPIMAGLAHPAGTYAADKLEDKYFSTQTGSKPGFTVSKAAYACIENTHTRIIDQGDSEYCYRELHDPGAGTDAVMYTLTAPIEKGIIRAEFHVRLPVCSNYPQEEARQCARAQEAWRMPAILARLETALAGEVAPGGAREYTFFTDVNCRPAESHPAPVDTYSCHPTPKEPRRTITYLASFMADFDADEELEEMSLYTENTGGSGTFYYAIVKETRGSLSRPVLLGDRLQFKSAVVTADQQGLRLEYTGHGPDDALCCPTVQKTVAITYKNNQLAVSE